MPQRLLINDSMPLDVKTLLNLSMCKPAMDFKQLVAALDITYVLDKSVHELSGGEYQRVLLARAFIAQPDLLILDEPTQGLDVVGQKKLYDALFHLIKVHHTTVLMVSHDMHMVFSASDQVICLNHHICCSGKPESVRQDKSYQDIFGDTSVALYQHDHDHEHI